MKKKRFSLEQIVGVLKQAEVGVPVIPVDRSEANKRLTEPTWRCVSNWNQIIGEMDAMLLLWLCHEKAK